ncbi:multicopper oxidase [Pilimelia anulata]|uniref:Multicopper oxidase n=1 Tax=Pilimelia anulata TaxID=53371 RepID=A0A8J3B387_9ACTN|nr:multicopper oxidase domain-containing protein [Pilimelia anulata]GGJ83785.1 multicopper oxidase [Pilimelia anulata]
MAIPRAGRLLIGGLAGMLALCGGGAAVGGTLLWNAGVLDTAGKVAFATPLAIPPLAPSRLDGRGRRVFDLTAAPGTHDIGGRAVATWGYNGGYLGPTLRAARGERVLVNVTNRLGEPTTVHWHGMRLPALMDGGPHQPIPPGGTLQPTWRVDQPAATLWYHPHPHGATAPQVYRGLAGLFLLDEPDGPGEPGGPGGAALPGRYGVDDVPVLVTDVNVDGDRLDEDKAAFSDLGILGRQVLANGVAGAYHDVRTEAVRLRLVNASPARSYGFGLADGRPFDLVGTDGGLLAAPDRRTRLRLTPGERAEIVVRLRPGERVVLRSFPPGLHSVPALFDRAHGGHDTLDVLELRAAAALAPSPPLPAALAALPAPDPAGAATRTFRLSGHKINGRKMDPGRLDAEITRGSTEVWAVRNADGVPHSFHVHDVRFRVLDPGDPALAGWKDTVYVPPNRELRLLIRFDGASDPAHPYMFHCHKLAHEDGGMMGQFAVVEPGQRALPPPPLPAAHDH